MKKAGVVRSMVAAAVIAAYGASGAALAVDEVEPNSTITDAQLLLIDASRSATVFGVLEDGAADFYSFWAKEGDVVTFDVDGNGAIDSWLTVLEPVLEPAPAIVVAASVDDSSLPSLDPGSTTSLDPYVENLRIRTTGIHYVVVSAQPNYGVYPYLPVLDGGMVNVNRGNATGAYTLIVSNVSPQEAPPAPTPDPVTPPAPTPGPVSLPAGEVQHISIDIKPGRGMIVRLDPKGRHSIPVALLSSKDFDALAVDVGSLTFGQKGDEQSLRKCAARGIDVNRDGRRDLVCDFVNHLAQFELGDSEGIVRGKTAAGAPFEGRGMLKVIPHKRHHRHFDSHNHTSKNARDDDDHKNKKARNDDDDHRKGRAWWHFWR